MSAEAGNTEPDSTEPDSTEAGNTEPGGTKPGNTEPGIAEARGAEAGDIESAENGVSANPAAEPAAGRSRWRLHRPRGKASRLELPILIVIAVGIAVLLKTFVIQPFYIPSASMENTLHGCTGCSGDRILVFKPVYDVRQPHAGDVVVFKAPQAWNEGAGTVLSSNPIVHAAQWAGQLVGVVAPSERDLVKRVIATGGQTVKCCDANGNVQVSDDGRNFRSLNEPYIFENDELSFGPVLVPEGRLWVLGDHRGNSADSRYHCLPDIEDADPAARSHCDPVSSTVAISSVLGKSVVIAWPPSRWRTLGTPATFVAAAGSAVGAAAQPAVAAIAAVSLFGLRRRRLRRKKPSQTATVHGRKNSAES